MGVGNDKIDVRYLGEEEGINDKISTKKPLLVRAGDNV